MSRFLSRNRLFLSSSWTNWSTQLEPRRFVQSNHLLNETYIKRSSSNENVDLTNLPEREKDLIFKVKEVVTPISQVKELMEADESLQSPDYFQVHNLFTVNDLFTARVHMGHKIGSMHKNMRPFIFGSRFDSLVFDLDLTAFHLRQALNFLAHISYRKGIILFVTRSPQTIHLVEKAAMDCGEYAHTRAWEESIFTDPIKKFGGITRLPDVLVFFNTLDTVLAQHRGVINASKLLIPTVAIVDSNCDPNLITYPIPGNDDSIQSIEFYCKLFKEAILRGKNKRKLLESRLKGESNVVEKE